MRVGLVATGRRMAVALIACTSLLALGAAGASGAGYATHLSKGTVHASEPRAALKGSPSGFMSILFKTNTHDQVTTLIENQIEGIPIACTKGSNKSVGTESLAEYEAIHEVRSTGAFEFEIPLTYAPVKIKVVGKLTGHGTHASAEVTVTSTTPEFQYGLSEGCRLTTPSMSWSAGLKWKRFEV